MYHEFLFALAGASAAGIGIQLLALNPARRTIKSLEARIVKAEADLSAEKFETENLVSTNARLRRWLNEEKAKQQPRDPKTGRMLPKFKAVA